MCKAIGRCRPPRMSVADAVQEAEEYEAALNQSRELPDGALGKVPHGESRALELCGLLARHAGRSLNARNHSDKQFNVNPKESCENVTTENAPKHGKQSQKHLERSAARCVRSLS